MISANKDPYQQHKGLSRVCTEWGSIDHDGGILEALVFFAIKQRV
ncbi:hypothetical protein [Salinivibrio kushneri]|nr:hypothetical protein [Salinivibrio kushneri]